MPERNVTRQINTQDLERHLRQLSDSFASIKGDRRLHHQNYEVVFYHKRTYITIYISYITIHTPGVFKTHFY